MKISRKSQLLSLVLTVILLGFQLSVKAQTSVAPTTGNGEIGTPYEIETLSNLYWLSQTESVWDKYFIQTANIDAADTKNWGGGRGFISIGTYSTDFTGTYDGGGHTISNLFMDLTVGDNEEDAEASLFYSIGTGGLVTKLGLVQIDYNSDSGAAAFVDELSGTLSQCYATGIIRSQDSDNAGLVQNLEEGTVSDCYADVKILSDYYNGGLINYAYGGIVERSYAIGKINEGESQGGLFAYYYETDITNLYWNTELTGLDVAVGDSEDEGGTGLTNSQMLVSSNFTGFDFENIWQIDEGQSFPFLRNVVQSPKPGATPVQVSPESNSKGQLLLPNFTWIKINPNAQFDLQVSTSEDFSSTIINETGLVGTSFQTLSSLSTSTNYFWRIRNVVESNPGDWSLVFPFTTTKLTVGIGTEAEPFQLSTMEQVNEIRFNTIAYYELSQNIDASVETNTESGLYWNSGKGFEPIKNFSGNLDGNDFVISGLMINREDDEDVGFFENILTGGTVSNLGLIAAEIHGNDGSGILVGSNEGTITLSFAKGTIIGGDYTGGLIGYNSEDGIIQKSYTNSIVSGSDYVGGFSGFNNGEISQSYSQGLVDGDDKVGGFTGGNEGLIETSFSVSTVIGNDYVGGFVADSDGEINQSYASGSIISATGNTGGFVVNGDYSISDSYWNSSVAKENNTSEESMQLNNTSMRAEASFVGFDFTEIWQISEGVSFPYLQSITPENLPGVIPQLVSPSIGYKNVPFLSTFEWAAFTGADFYEVQVSESYNFDSFVIEQSNIAATTFESETEFETGSQYFWRLRAINASDTTDWSPIGYFTTTEFDEGDGTNQSPFIVKNVTHLNAIRNGMSAYYELANDLDIRSATGESGGKYWNDGEGFRPIGYNTFGDSEEFTGVFNGAGFSIYGLYIKVNNSNLALFKTVGAGGTIIDVNMDSVYIKTSSSAAGLVFDNKGTIENCSTNGYIESFNVAGGLVGLNYGSIISSNSSLKIKGRDFIGGLVGSNEEEGTITKSYSTGTVTGTYYVGALVGRNSGSISKSYATGEVIGASSLGRSAFRHGGIAGQNWGTISDSYSTATLGNGKAYGGIAGDNSGTVERSYSASFLEVSNEPHRNGGVVGENTGTITNAYWNYNIFENNNSIGLPMSSDSMRHASSFAGFDFENVWQINELGSFPYLQNVETNILPGQLESNFSGNSLAFTESSFSVPNNIAYDDSGHLTLEAWVYFNKTGRQGIIEKHQSPNSGFWVDYNGDITVVLVTENGERAVSSNINPVINRWYHLAVTYDAADIKIYLDGVDVSEANTGSGSGVIENNSRAINIGNLNWSSNTDLDGKMDEVRIWSSVRTEEEIRSTMYQSLNGDEEDLITYLPFDEAEGTTILDKSSTKNNTSFGSGIERSEETHPYGTFISGTQGFRMMSSPMQNSDFATILDTLWTQGFTGADSESGNSNVYIWDESSYDFVSISNASDVPTAGKGFISFVYDDQDFDGIAEGFPKSIQIADSQNKGEITAPVTFTESETESNQGWNLVGNPYGTSIDWDYTSGVVKQNVDDVIYVWSNTADEGNGAYLTWNGETGSLGSGLIAPWQGFWIKANAESPSLIMNDELRSSGAVLQKKQSVPKLSFSLSNGARSTSTYLMFNEAASIEKDRMDAYKLESLSDSDFALFTRLQNGDAIDINALPLVFSENMEIPILMQGAILEGNFDLSWNLESIPEFLTLTLRNNSTGELIPLKSQEKVRIEFLTIEEKTTTSEEMKTLNHSLIRPNVLKGSGNVNSTYSLLINSSQIVGLETESDLPKSVELSQNFPNPFNPSTTIQFALPTTSPVTLEVYSVLGQRVSVLINNETIQAGRHSVSFNASELASGMYLYRLIAGNTVFVKKLTLIK